MIAKRKGAQEHTAQEKDTRRLVKPGEPKGRGDGEREKNRIRQRQQNETTKGGRSSMNTAKHEGACAIAFSPSPIKTTIAQKCISAKKGQGLEEGEYSIRGGGWNMKEG